MMLVAMPPMPASYASPGIAPLPNADAVELLELFLKAEYLAFFGQL